MARARGADTIVDAAHSFGQVDVKMADIGADFVGCNLHKWLGAPVGIGVMYIKASRIGDVDRMLADESGGATSIDSRIHTGTTNFATTLTVPAAIDFHEAVGAAFKAARVRYLRDRWVSAVRNTRGIDIMTPDDRDWSPGSRPSVSTAASAARRTRPSPRSCWRSTASSRSGATAWPRVTACV